MSLTRPACAHKFNLNNDNNNSNNEEIKEQHRPTRERPQCMGFCNGIQCLQRVAKNDFFCDWQIEKKSITFKQQKNKTANRVDLFFS